MVKNKMDILKIIQDFYLKNCKFEDVLALQKIEEELQKKGMSKKEVEYFFKDMYNKPHKPFKYIFTTLPYWGTKYKGVLINGESFTHIILIQDLFS